MDKNILKLTITEQFDSFTERRIILKEMFLNRG